MKTNNSSRGKMIAGALLSLLIAVGAPVSLTVEAFALYIPLMAAPLLTAVLWACFGKKHAYICLILQPIAAALLGGSFIMWACVLTEVLPMFLLLASVRKGSSFDTILGRSIIYFLFGTIAALLIAKIRFGGNLIGALFDELKGMMRQMPEGYWEESAQLFGNAFRMNLGGDSLMTLVGNAFDELVPYYQNYYPGVLFSRIIVTALVAAAVAARSFAKREDAGEVYRPVSEWTVPSGVIRGLVFVLVVCGVMYLAKVRNIEMIFETVMAVLRTVFCIQAFASVRRRTEKKRALCFLLSAALCVAACIGMADYIAIYGIASALFGSRGVLKRPGAKNDGNDEE